MAKFNMAPLKNPMPSQDPEIRMRGDETVRRENDCEYEPHYDRRYGYVRRLSFDGGRTDEVRVRRRT